MHVFEMRRIPAAGSTAVRQSLGSVSTSSPKASPRMPQFIEKKPLSTTSSLVAGPEQVDECRLPRAVPGRGIGKYDLVGLGHPVEAGKALLGDGAELRTVEVDRAAIHRSRYSVRNIDRTGVDDEVVSATDRHARSLVFAFLYSSRCPARVRSGRVEHNRLVRRCLAASP